jgi:Na+/proline symporter
MVIILHEALGLSGLQAAVVLLAVTAGYSMLAGLWGVVMTDLFQFVFAMGGSIVLAVAAVHAAGGLERLTALTAAHFGGARAAFGILPPLDSPWLPLSSLLVFLFIQWWATWYPGAEPGGGGYVAQRIFATRDERHGLLATLWFNVAHYAVRPWPWILVGCFTAVRYPGLANPERGYVKAMVDLLPSPLKGVMLAAFAAAYMSTISTHLNWGASYLVNDVWLRFVRRRASPREQVLVSRAATGLLMLLAIGVMLVLSSVEQGWRFLLAFGAGTGSVLILRWYWWRINAWSELVAMAASFVTSLAVWRWGHVGGGDPAGRDYAAVLLVTVGVTTAAWLAATFLTRPEAPEVLEGFYRRVRPGGPGWRAVARRLGYADDPISGGARAWANWLAGIVAVYGALFGLGELLVGTAAGALAYLGAGAAAFAVIARNLRRDTTLRRGAVDSGSAAS